MRFFLIRSDNIISELDAAQFYLITLMKNHIFNLDWWILVIDNFVAFKT